MNPFMPARYPSPSEWHRIGARPQGARSPPAHSEQRCTLSWADVWHPQRDSNPCRHLESEARRRPLHLGGHRRRPMHAGGPSVTACAPDSPSGRARIGRAVNLLIRRLIRPVRPGSFEVVALVERPESSVASRWRPTSWVHDGYTPGAAIVSLGTAPFTEYVVGDLRGQLPRPASVNLPRTRRVARLWRPGLRRCSGVVVQTVGHGVLLLPPRPARLRGAA